MYSGLRDAEMLHKSETRRSCIMYNVITFDGPSRHVTWDLKSVTYTTERNASMKLFQVQVL